MDFSSLSGVASLVPNAASGLTGDPAAGSKVRKATEAAGQFESLLIAQMLKSMREDGSGWLGTGEDKTADSAIGMAEEHLASAISSAGGFGLTRMVSEGLQAPSVHGSVAHISRGKSSGG